GFLPNLYSAAQQDPLCGPASGGGGEQRRGGAKNTPAWVETSPNSRNSRGKSWNHTIAPGRHREEPARNFGPRFGVLYDHSGVGKTVIRGGYGLYFESGNGNEAQTEGGEGNPPAALSPSGFNILGYSNVLPGAIGPTGYTAIPYNQGWPYVQQFNVNVQ